MQCALPDGEFGLGGDADELWAFDIQLVPVGCAHLLERGPLLPARSDVLAVILADGAVLWRKNGVGVLHAAGGADVLGHNEK